MSVRPFERNSLSENAVIAIGTSWMFSLRFSAVTTISCSSSELATLADVVCADADSGNRPLTATSTHDASSFMLPPQDLYVLNQWSPAPKSIAPRAPPHFDA